jgi:hypothetical protein
MRVKIIMDNVQQDAVKAQKENKGSYCHFVSH